MENSLSYINVLPGSKTELSSFYNNIKSEILSGSYNVLKIDMQFKYIEELVKMVRKDSDIKNLIIEEIEKEGGKLETSNGTIEISRRTTYDFSVDSEWLQIQQEIDKLKAKQKGREKILKSGIDAETGEEIVLPSKTTESPKYSLK